MLSLDFLAFVVGWYSSACTLRFRVGIAPLGSLAIAAQRLLYILPTRSSIGTCYSRSHGVCRRGLVSTRSCL